MIIISQIQFKNLVTAINGVCPVKRKIQEKEENMFKAKNKDTRQIGEKAQHSEVVVAQDKQNFNVALIS